MDRKDVSEDSLVETILLQNGRILRKKVFYQLGMRNYNTSWSHFFGRLNNKMKV